MDECELGDNGKTLQHDLEENRLIWKDENTDIRTSFKNLDGLLHAVQTKDVEEIAKIYYRAQHQHTLAEHTSPYIVKIFVHLNLNGEWVPHIRNAIECINTAAPGLCLHETKTIEEARIQIANIGDSKTAWTKPGEKPIMIHFGSDWPKEQMQGTSLHELLHALGFDHQMQRANADLYLDFNFQSANSDAYAQYRGDIEAVTRFDPFSVLMYTENDKMKRKEKDPIWKMKPDKNRLQKLSELDKVALNLLYKPCRSLRYAPKISKQTGMLYCGRAVMESHNQCTPGTTVTTAAQITGLIVRRVEL